jgi:uncharacterized membrane protein YeaQ/YmgE (transglycosylase-associated protein family)
MTLIEFLIEFLVLLIVAGACGAIGRAIIGNSHLGFLDAVALCGIGAFAGVRVAGKLGLPRFYELRIGETSLPVIWSIIGAGLVVFILGLLASQRRQKTITF